MVRFVVAPFQLIWRHRVMLIQTTGIDLRARHAGSVIGIGWFVLYPVLFLGVYAAVYHYIFKVRMEGFNREEYVVFIFCGLVPFLGFAEALANGVPSVTSNANLVKNTLFPVELIPVKAVVIVQPAQFVGLAMLLIAVFLVGRASVWCLLLPIGWCVQFMFTVGVVWILSSSNVFLRDLRNVVAVITLLLLVASPIAYSADMVPSSIRLYLQLNPLYYIIDFYRACLILGQAPSASTVSILVTLAVVFFSFGYWYFRRLKIVFAENV